MPDGSTINPFTTADQMTLANVLERIDSDESLSTQRRRNLCSSIRSLGKLMGKNLQYLPAHPGYYRPFFNQLHPEQCDLTESRIRNIKSDVLFALRQSGSIQSKGSYMAPLVGEWHKLWETAESEKNMRRYCSR